MKVHERICLIIFSVLFYSTFSLFGQKHIYLSFSNTKEINVPEENYISAINAGAVFGIGNYIYAGGGLNATKVWSSEYSSLGLGAGPNVRIYLLKKSKIKFLLEGTGRVMYLFPEYPGTELNFAFWGGPAVEFYILENHRLNVGMCYNHLSNGKRHEQDYNRSLDGIGVTIGWTFY